MKIQSKKAITELAESAFRGKRVLVRLDLNVPLNPDGSIASDYRIQAALPTLRYLLDRHAKVIVMSHLGRPKNGPEAKYSLQPVVQRLEQLLPDILVSFWKQSPLDAETAHAIEQMEAGHLMVLENIRFEPGETRNDPDLSRLLASFADIYVNDAFGAAHRAHASTEGLTHFVPLSLAGLLMKKELTMLGQLVASPERPLTAIIGGSKVSTKIGVMENLLPQVDTVVIGGGMIFTFLKAQGLAVGSSLVEPDYLALAANLLAQAKQSQTRIMLPTDIVIADRFEAGAQVQTVHASEIPEGWMGLDIGPNSAEEIAAILTDSKTVFWNGPLGVFEFPAFAEGTRKVAQVIAKRTQSGKLVSILGGGDTEAALDQFGIATDQYTHVSTGGGATLELLEGKSLPGITALADPEICVPG